MINLNRRDMLRAGSLGLGGLGLSSLLDLREVQAADQPASFGKAEAGDPALSVWRGGSARDVGSQAGCPGGDSRQVQADQHGGSGHADLRAPAAGGEDRRPAVLRPVDVASVQHSLGRVHDVGDRQGRYPDGAEPVRLAALAELRQRARLPGPAKRVPHAPPPAIPRNLCLPFRFSSRCAQFKRGGPYGGFLGRAYDPICTEFEGQITGKIEPLDRQRDGQGRRAVPGHRPPTASSRFPSASADG